MVCSLTPVSMCLTFEVPTTARGRDQRVPNPLLNSDSMKELTMEGLQSADKYLRNI